MLAPDNRALLLDALRPPPEHCLDRAVATTFTLDLESALMVPLALAGLRLDDDPNPIDLMAALGQVSERFDIFCQAGAINVAGRRSDLVALLEESIHEVKQPRERRIFHPKVWALRFLDGSKKPFYRLVVLSRNLTASRSWDTVLWLDGQIRDRRPIASNAPLARFFAALPGMAVSKLPSERSDPLRDFADDLRRVQWEKPDRVREVRFHPIGLEGGRTFQVEEHFAGYRQLVISPFVGEGLMQKVLGAGTGRKAVLISRGEALQGLPKKVHDRLDPYELDSAAQLSLDDAEEERSQSSLTNLHAKVFVVERLRLAHLFVGSANATEGAFSGNVEFLCELVGPTARYGVDAIVGENAPLRTMLTAYEASKNPETDPSETAARKLERLLMAIAQAGFRTTVSRQDDGWLPRITVGSKLPRIPENASVTIAPYNRATETYELHPAEPVDIELPLREIVDVTAFLQLTARQTDGGVVVERSTLVCSRLEGAPEDRRDEILARQIDSPEKFMRLLSLLMGFASGSVPGNGGGTGGWGGSWSAGPGQGVLELLARALSENPKSIDQLATIVEHLRGSSKGRQALPPGWDDVWKPAFEARRAMQEADT